ncbi:hypothetical protein LDENG_00034980 [Lucifuga dentata]|nr:hypothetical protein LDENG_00034980 [Lucifuga dentata]
MKQQPRVERREGGREGGGGSSFEEQKVRRERSQCVATSYLCVRKHLSAEGESLTFRRFRQFKAQQKDKYQLLFDFNRLGNDSDVDFGHLKDASSRCHRQ